MPALCLLVSGCGGFGGYVRNTFWRSGDPHAPESGTLTVDRARGDTVAVPLVLPVQGNIWPGAAPRVPTLQEIQQGMNQPGAMPAQSPAGPSRPSIGGSAMVPSTQSGVPLAPHAGPARAVPPPPPAPITSPFRRGQMVMTPNGPGGVVTSDGAGGYQTVAPVDGRGGGILVPSGNGAATLIGPDGQVSPVSPPGR
jgi:hypothetical protein